MNNSEIVKNAVFIVLMNTAFPIRIVYLINLIDPTALMIKPLFH